MNGVIYARYSSDSQTENSIEGQLRECKDFAKRNGLTSHTFQCTTITPQKATNNES